MVATKFDYDVAFGLAPQTAEGLMNPVLDGISGTWNGQGGAGGADEGLLLGDANSGVNGSGLDITMGRRSSENPKVTASLTTPISNFEAGEARNLRFAFPFCGNRDDAAATIVSADVVPLIGMDAVLVGVGMAGVAGANPPVEHLYRFATPSPFPISALAYYFGNRIEYKDCRVSSLQITYEPGSVPIAVADIVVGSVQDPSILAPATAALPTLTYGDQNTINAPIVENAAFTWSGVLGFSTLVLTITPNIVQIPDSNMPDGFVLEYDGREVTIALTNYADSEGDDDTYELGQIFAAASGELDAMSWRTGVLGTDSNPAKGHRILIPQPEVDTVAMANLGTKAANTLLLRARHDTANRELDIIFD